VHPFFSVTARQRAAVWDSLAFMNPNANPFITHMTTMPPVVLWGCHDSMLGPLLMGVTQAGLCRLEFTSGYGLDYDLSLWQQQWPGSHFIAQASASAHLACQFRNTNPLRWGGATLALYGTDFQLKVWKALLQIEQGRVMQHEEIATLIGKPGAARAVRLAVEANPISILIPCHRAVDSHPTKNTPTPPRSMARLRMLE